MRVTAISTNQMATIRASNESEAIPARVWEAETESGIKCLLYVTRVVAHKGTDQSEFEKELTECSPPTEETWKAIPLRMIL